MTWMLGMSIHIIQQPLILLFLVLFFSSALFSAAEAALALTMGSLVAYLLFQSGLR